jgi:hypothetical protein
VSVDLLLSHNLVSSEINNHQLNTLGVESQAMIAMSVMLQMAGEINKDGSLAVEILVEGQAGV